MNLFLYFLLLIAGAGAYYEYTWQQQTDAGFQPQLEIWQQKVDRLVEANAKLKKDGASLVYQDTDARNEVARLTTDLANAQKSAAPKPAAPAAAPVVTANPNALGTITTILGQTYHNCQLLKVEASDIIINDSDGIMQVPFSDMMPDLQKHFGYDPQKAAALDEAQIRYQEQLRQSNTPGGQ